MYPKKTLGAAVAVSLVYLSLLATVQYFQLGLIRPSNPILPIVVEIGGGVILWFAAAVAIGFSVRALVRRKYFHFLTLIVTGATLGCAPLISRAITPRVVATAEARDLRLLSIAQLREEAAALIVAESGNRRGPVSISNPPTAIRQLANHLRPLVTVYENCVTIRKDGLASWRASYVITPPGSAYVPGQSRRIVDGLFYASGL